MRSAEWDERYETSDYVWSVKANQFVEQQLTGLPPGKAIDLGAGECRNAVWLATRGWDVTAVDFSSVGLDKGRRLAADNDVSITVVEADATSWEPDATVDLVVISYLQLDRSGRTTVLEHAKTWLRPGGRVFVIAHDASNVDGGYGGPPSPEVCYTPEHVVAALEGLVIEQAGVVERTVQTPDGPKVALDTLVMARLDPPIASAD